ncbi:MAG: ORF6N domain-containing protein [Lachnospiraceae bacterium]|nr:ORF6N domain-containing protein [Lachnospiraceae bacterium]
MSNNEIIEFNLKEKVKTQIIDIRGHKVMMDSDIAVYFGVETKALNRAMKRNIKRFPEHFCFQLTRDEYRQILRCQSGTLKFEQGKYSKYPPYVYTESGVAMLTSVLHTERAIEASIQIIEAFVELSHYVRQNRKMIPYDELKALELKHYQLSHKVNNIEENMVTRADLSELMKLFDSGNDEEEILILDGEPFKADEAFQKIYKMAKKSIIVVDDYLGVKTLRHLAHAKSGVDLTIISDNKGYTPLRLTEYTDFQTEYPGKQIRLIRTMNKVHDRFIILDYETKFMKIYLCGSSSKDSGNKITAIIKINEINAYKDCLNGLLTNPTLILR